jgi:hypothetical protein
VTADSPPPAAPRYKLRWYQYSLRTLMLVVLLVSIGMSYVAVTIQRQRRQGEAAKAIRQAGGVVGCSPTWLGNLLRDYSLLDVDCAYLGSSTTDAGLANLEELKGLQLLFLEDTQITDAGLAHLHGLKNLLTLSLNGTKVTDAGLVHLEGLSELRSLFLRNTRMTDAGLEHLRGLLSLRSLELSGTNVTDEGVKTLCEALPNLEVGGPHGR